MGAASPTAVSAARPNARPRSSRRPARRCACCPISNSARPRRPRHACGAASPAWRRRCGRRRTRAQRPALTNAGRRVFNDLRAGSDGQRRPATPPLAPPLAPRREAMIDPEIRRLFNELFETTLRERRIALPQALANVKEQMSARGMLNSGRTVVLVGEVYRHELKGRGAMAFEFLQQVLS